MTMHYLDIPIHCSTKRCSRLLELCCSLHLLLPRTRRVAPLHHHGRGHLNTPARRFAGVVLRCRCSFAGSANAGHCRVWLRRPPLRRLAAPHRRLRAPASPCLSRLQFLRAHWPARPRRPPAPAQPLAGAASTSCSDDHVAPPPPSPRAQMCCSGSYPARAPMLAGRVAAASIGSSSPSVLSGRLAPPCSSPASVRLAPPRSSRSGLCVDPWLAPPSHRPSAPPRRLAGRCRALRGLRLPLCVPSAQPGSRPARPAPASRALRVTRPPPPARLVRVGSESPAQPGLASMLALPHGPTRSTYRSRPLVASARGLPPRRIRPRPTRLWLGASASPQAGCSSPDGAPRLAGFLPLLATGFTSAWPPGRLASSTRPAAAADNRVRSPLARFRSKPMPGLLLAPHRPLPCCSTGQLRSPSCQLRAPLPAPRRPPRTALGPSTLPPASCVQREKKPSRPCKKKKKVKPAA
ncbi:hypothetical protein VPH35_089705 [Triticum aestivum]